VSVDRLDVLRAQTAPPFDLDHWQGHLPTVNLEQFRGQTHYLYQRSELDLYGAMMARLRLVDDWGLLDTLTEDDAFGCLTYHVNGKVVSRDLLDSIEEIYFLRDQLSWQQTQHVNVLDIGAGYGRLAHRLDAAMPNAQVWCTDAIAESTWVCERYLSHCRVSERVHVVPFADVQGVGDVRFDAAVAIHSWSECNTAAIRWWVDYLVEREVPAVLYVGVRQPESVITSCLSPEYELRSVTTGDLDRCPFLWYTLR
jgi:putative sugar O-methyltransferase